MKRIVKIILSCAFVLCLSGCISEKTEMSINADKSVNLEMIYAINSEILDEITTANVDDANIFTKETYEPMEENGFTIEEYEETKDDVTFKGVKLTKKYDSIDKITKDTEIPYVFTEKMQADDDFDDSYMFSKKDNVYTSNIMFDYINHEIEDDITEDTADVVKELEIDGTYDIEFEFESSSLNGIAVELDTDNKKVTGVANGISTLLLTDADGNEKTYYFIVGTGIEEDPVEPVDPFAEFSDEFDLKYKVTLPTKAISSNATTVSEDGKSLEWKLEYGKENYVDYKFKFEEEKNPETSDAVVKYLMITTISLLGLGSIILLNKRK